MGARHLISLWTGWFVVWLTGSPLFLHLPNWVVEWYSARSSFMGSQGYPDKIWYTLYVREKPWLSRHLHSALMYYPLWGPALDSNKAPLSFDIYYCSTSSYNTSRNTKDFGVPKINYLLVLCTTLREVVRGVDVNFKFKPNLYEVVTRLSLILKQILTETCCLQE